MIAEILRIEQTGPNRRANLKKVGKNVIDER